MDVDSTLVLARWGYFLSVMILFGSSFFPFYALNKTTRLAQALLPRGVNLGLALAALAFASAWLGSFAAGLAGDEGILETLRGVLLESGFGPVWIVRLSLALVLLGASLWGRQGYIAGAALLMLTCEGWQGHAAVWGLAASLTQAVHVAAAGAWIGGLVPLGRVIVSARRNPAIVADVMEALRRFSRFGIVAVAIVAATGGMNTWQMLGGIPNAGDAYGRALLFKIGLFAAMVGLALYNRYSLHRQIEADPARALRALSRNVVWEQVLGFVVLLAVSALGLMTPYM